MVASQILVVDNGGCNLKLGYSSKNEPRVMPNAIMKAKSERRRPFIGDQIDDCRDVSGLYYILPYQKGYLINWEAQKDIWDYAFGKDGLNVNFSHTTVVLTEPYFNFHSIQEGLSEIFFEEFECEALLRVNAGSLSAFKYGEENPSELCCLLVDCGYSFTHIVPYVMGKKVTEAIIRIDIGGKLLTNHLKDIISYRQLHVMDETHVINQLKEDTCYVSMDFNAEMRETQKKGSDNSIVVDYVLPDYTTIRRGFVRPKDAEHNPSEQVIRMNNERFAVPELLFHPSDIGINQMGISEAIIKSIDTVSAEARPHLYKNIYLTGGTCNLPNFRERVERDVRANAPHDIDVRVTVANNPTTDAWKGGSLLTKESDFHKRIVTKRDYEERGAALCSERFDV